MALPFILFLDIDKTMIGRSHALTARFWLRKAVQEMAREGVLPAALARRCPPATAEDAQVGPDLLRPGLGDALRAMARALRLAAGAPCLELFVCSLGTRANVAECKVPGIERHARVRFNRPLFCASQDGAPDNCRASSAEDKKLVRSCFLRAVQALSNKKRWASALARPGAVDAVWRSRFLMIDDTPDIALDAESNARVHLCPAYQRQPWVDATAGAPRAALAHPAVRAYLKAHPPPPRRRAEEAEEDADAFWPTFADAFCRAARQTKPGQPRAARKKNGASGTPRHAPPTP